MAVGHWVYAVAKVKALGDRDAILAILDAMAGGEDVDICTFRTEFAVALYKKKAKSCQHLDDPKAASCLTGWLSCLPCTVYSSTEVGSVREPIGRCPAQTSQAQPSPAATGGGICARIEK